MGDSETRLFQRGGSGLLRDVPEHSVHQPGYFRESHLAVLRVLDVDNAVARLVFRLSQWGASIASSAGLLGENWNS